MPLHHTDSATTLRQRLMDTSRAALVEALQRQDEAERRLVEAEHAIHRETARATHPDAPDELVEALAAWLPEGQRRQAEAQDAMDYAAAQAAQARTALSMARAAETAAGAPAPVRPSPVAARG